MTELQPARNSLLLDNGGRVTYDYLVVCPGLQLNWAGIEGLEETIGVTVLAVIICCPMHATTGSAFKI